MDNLRTDYCNNNYKTIGIIIWTDCARNVVWRQVNIEAQNKGLVTNPATLESARSYSGTCQNMSMLIVGMCCLAMKDDLVSL